MRFKTEMEACREWVDTFNNIPGSPLERAYGPEGDALKLLAGGSRKSDCCGIVSEETADDPRHPATGNEDVAERVYKCSECDKPCGWSWGGAEYAWPAGWGTLFNPKDSSDEDWMNRNAEQIADKCGLLVYECDEVGILLGVDGGGYDFYEQHWLPLYRLRGLEWHEKVEVKPAKVEAKAKPHRMPRGKALPKTKAKVSCQHRSRFDERVCEAEAEERADRKAELAKRKSKPKAKAKTKARRK